MKRPKLTAADVLARLAPTDLHLADDDDLLAGVERAIENITDPQAALAYAIAFRSGLRSGPSANAAEPVPAPASPVAQASLDEVRQQAEREGALAQRERLRAILTDPLAADRWDAARHLAFHTSMTAPEAIALLQTVGPSTPADALKSLPAHVARACNSPTGLVGFNAQAGTIATVEAGGASAGASIGFAPAPDPFVKADPNARNRAAWKRTTDALNGEADHAIRG
ncbi:hypothetical protein NIK97_06705 [Brucella pseudintermedia]|uniref:Uncharacterized protein n=1 Tax=Brucella pseudintermedia TaxID=370111 RepID=A0ABY5U7B5_9HYPH|nr:hypothetical protein [Brucella pseudintermedia]UWL59240.1 hypothetical protein NIK97_06705 [Brucella pseudintermedia]